MKKLFFKGLLAGLFSLSLLAGCSQEEKSAPLPELPKVELPKGFAGFYTGRLPCDNCKVRMVRMELAEDSSVFAIETILTDVLKGDSLKGTYSTADDKVYVTFDNGKKWNFQLGNSGALSLLTGAGTVYKDENDMPADLIRIINKPKVEGEKK
jgi:hypothetical protein